MQHLLNLRICLFTCFLLSEHFDVFSDSIRSFLVVWWVTVPEYFSLLAELELVARTMWEECFNSEESFGHFWEDEFEELAVL